MKHGLRSALRLVVLLSLGGSAFAADNAPESIAKRIAPLTQANLIVRVDLTRLEVDRLTAAVTKQFGKSDEISKALSAYENLIETAKANDVEEMYFALRIIDVPSPGPLFVFPGVKPSAAKRLNASVAAFLPQAKAKATDWIEGGAVVLGSEEAIQSLPNWNAGTADSRAQFTAATEAIKTHSIQIVGRLSADERRVIREVLHVLPEEVGGGSAGELVDGVHWLAIGASLPPNASAKAILQCSDAAAAERCKKQLGLMLEKLVVSPEAKRAWPNIDQLLTALKPNVHDNRLELAWSESDKRFNSLLSAFAQPLQRARSAARRAEATNDLKQIALAMHNHYDANRKFPNVGSKNDDGVKLLSWRVHLLPYLEEIELYEEFHLDEPWDSEHNKKLIPRMPKVFHTPGSKLKLSQGRSTYRVPSSPETIFPPDGDAKQFRDILDGTSNTALVLEVDDEHAVIWTKPEGLALNAERPHAGLGGHFDDIFLLALCDGSVRTVKKSISTEMLLNLLYAADGNVVRLP